MGLGWSNLWQGQVSAWPVSGYADRGFARGGWISVSLGSLKFPRDSRLDGED